MTVWKYIKYILEKNVEEKFAEKYLGWGISVHVLNVHIRGTCEKTSHERENTNDCD